MVLYVFIELQKLPTLLYINLYLDDLPHTTVHILRVLPSCKLFKDSGQLLDISLFASIFPHKVSILHVFIK